MHTCEMLFWSETDPPTVTVKFHGPDRDYLATFRLEALQVNMLDPNGRIRVMVERVRDGKVLADKVLVDKVLAG